MFRGFHFGSSVLVSQERSCLAPQMCEVRAAFSCTTLPDRMLEDIGETREAEPTFPADGRYFTTASFETARNVAVVLCMFCLPAGLTAWACHLQTRC